MSTLPYVVSFSTGFSTSAFNLDWPQGSLAGDLGLAFVESSNEAVTIPTGWTELTGSPQGAGTAGVDATAVRITGFYKVAPVSGQTFIPIADPGDHALATMLLIRSVNTTTPIHASFGSVIGTAQSSVNGPAVSTTTDNCLIVFAAAEGVDNSVARFNPWFPNAVMSGFTGIVNIATSNGDGGGVSVAAGALLSAGSSSAATTTLLTASFLGYLTVALTPGPPSTGSGTILPVPVVPIPSYASWVFPVPVVMYGAST